MQLFVNSVDLEHRLDWLPDWLAERGAASSLDRAQELREALRSLLVANGGGALDPGAVEIVDRAAARLSIRLEPDGRPRVGSADGDPLDRVVAVSLEAMLDGTWQRLKACRNCRWAFYDYSRNRSATWCSMQLCGNRTKTRAYRRRRRSGP